MNPRTKRARTNKAPSCEDYLTREDFRARFDAEKLALARHYCTLFGFWRSCRFKPCRRARACKGDHRACLQRAVGRIARAEQFAARQRLLAMTPANLPAPERAARDLMPNTLDDSWAALRPRDIPAGWTRTGRRNARK